MRNDHLPESSESCCGSQKASGKKPWYRNGLILTLSACAVLLAASYAFPPFAHFHHAFFDYLRMIFWPIVFGFLIGGFIDRFVPREYISKYLARKNKRTILYATGLGFLMTACSHGILALSMELHKKGASGPAVVSFLLASPWANLPVTFLLIGFFGWRGILIIFAALLVAVTTGLILQALDEKGWIEKNKHAAAVDPDFSIRKDIAKKMKAYRFSWSAVKEDVKGVAKGMKELAAMVLTWLFVGIILASLLSSFVPSSIFHRFLGPSVFGLLMTMALATVLEVCSEGTAPLAFEIYKQTAAFGNAFAFLMGGVVTDYTEVGLVWINIGRRTALWMVLLALPQVFLLSWLFNLLFIRAG